MTRAACILTIAALSVIVHPAARAESVVAEGAEAVQVAGPLGFGEGPAAAPDGTVVFTDVMNARIQRIGADGSVSTVREQTGGANGLYFDAQGNLYACEMNARRISKMTPDGTVTTLADRWEGKRFNQPNDLWVDPKGGVYFTDPIYLRLEDQEIATESLYYIAPGSREVAQADADLVKPNGVIGTRDGKTLYVADHQGEVIYQYDIGAKGALSNRKKLIDRGSDGMTLDAQGNLYLTGAEEVAVYSKDGEALESISIPQGTTNVTFGGPDRKTLYVAGRNAIFAVKMRVSGN